MSGETTTDGMDEPSNNPLVTVLLDNAGFTGVELSLGNKKHSSESNHGPQGSAEEKTRSRGHKKRNGNTVTCQLSEILPIPG